MSILQPVTRTGCGCEGHDTSKKLMTIDAALDLIGHCVTIVDGTEDICLARLWAACLPTLSVHAACLLRSTTLQWTDLPFPRRRCGVMDRGYWT